MTFISICTALYDYHPQGDGELAIQEGELVYVLEKSTEDDWWKAKKRAVGEDEEEPMGLIPNNYVQEVCLDGIRYWQNLACNGHLRKLRLEQTLNTTATWHCKWEIES